MRIAIAAMTADRLIGKNNTLPRYIPEDLKRFKKLTTGHTVVMWRKTYESLPETFRPLPNRHNSVISSQNNYQLSTNKENTSVEVVHTIEDILKNNNKHKEKMNNKIKKNPKIYFLYQWAYVQKFLKQIHRWVSQYLRSKHTTLFITQ